MKIVLSSVKNCEKVNSVEALRKAFRDASC